MSSYQARVRRIYPRARLRRVGPGALPWRVFVPAQAGRPVLTLSEGRTPAGAWRVAADLVDPPARRVVRRRVISVEATAPVAQDFERLDGVIGRILHDLNPENRQ